MKKLPILKAGDNVELIAPASRCSEQLLSDIKALLTSWQLNCIVADDIFGDDLLCANSDAKRFQALKRALLNPDTQAVICARGGYGSMRLIPELEKITPPASPKLFMGMSDITALNIFLEQKWHWPTIHGALALDKFTPEAINEMQSILFAEKQQMTYVAKPLNDAAKKHHTVQAVITGGNLCLVQTSIGTTWQLSGRDKIIFLEEISERGYRIDRMLQHLQQARILKDAVAIVFGDFIEGNEPDGTSLVQQVLERFALTCDIPVVQIKGVGHARENLPLPLGTPATLELGNQAKLTCSR